MLIQLFENKSTNMNTIANMFIYPRIYALPSKKFHKLCTTANTVSRIWHLTAFSSLIISQKKIHVHKKRTLTSDELFEQLSNGKRSALATAITLIESTKPEHQPQANHILSLALKYLKSKTSNPSFRIGLTGAPGAGKSTLIETFGKKLTQEGHKVAVLAVDPSSAKTGGSLLGDRTRMIELAHDPNAYIRPSPASGTLGGVAKKTNEAIILCEAAGYDIVLVETVGIGQSEFAVSEMVDFFVLVIPPGSGDELQGIKKGIVEMADLVLVNKADGDLLTAARKVQSEYTSALKLLNRPNSLWKPKVYAVSSLHNEGFDKVWWKMQKYKSLMLENEIFHLNRRKQYCTWMWNYIEDNILENFKTNPNVKEMLNHYENLVEHELMTPSIAADNLLNTFFKTIKNK